MQRWNCPNCSHGNPMNLRQCGKCRFEPIGLDIPMPAPRGADSRQRPQAEPVRSPFVDAAVLALLALLVGWLGWMAGTLPRSAREPFAIYLVACTAVATWIFRRRRRIHRA